MKDLERLGEVIQEREMSGFPVAVGTGLALETLLKPVMEVLDPEREFEELKDLSKYDVVIFNVLTLLRNIQSSLSKEVADKIKIERYLATLIDEINFIKDIFANYGIEARFYYNTYKFYIDNYPDRIRKATTPNQLRTKQIEDYCIKNIERYTDNVNKFSQLVKYGDVRNVLLFSHVPCDLLSHGLYRKLELLESHTGKIKTLKDFNSKYYPIPREDMSNLPFFEYLLTQFGDKVMFKPQPIKKRKELMATLERLRVNPMSSEYSLLLKLK